MGRTLALSLLVLVVSACAEANRPMTPGEFYGFCWPAQIDSDCMDDSLCQDFQAYLEQDHPSKEACIRGCTELQMQKYQQDALRGCDSAISSAAGWCESYCRRLFDSGPPSQAGQKGAAEPQGQP